MKLTLSIFKFQHMNKDIIVIPHKEQHFLLLLMPSPITSSSLRSTNLRWNSHRTGIIMGTWHRDNNIYILHPYLHEQILENIVFSLFSLYLKECDNTFIFSVYMATGNCKLVPTGFERNGKWLIWTPFSYYFDGSSSW